MAGLTIGKFAAEAGVSVETVRFYQRRGLLELPTRRGSGFREYTPTDQWRLAFIRRARQLGITRAAEAKLAAIGDQIAELAALQCRLRRLVQVCAHGSRDDCAALHLGDRECAQAAS